MIGKWYAHLLSIFLSYPSNNGLQNIHCIGDRANKIVLDILEGLLATADARERRPRIEHAQIMQPGDLERAGKLGGIHIYATRGFQHSLHRSDY